MNATTNQVSLLMAFGAGLVSFLAPCMLPLIPVYVTYLLGTTCAGEETAARRRLILNAVAFVGGFSTVFIVLGVSATLLGQLLLANQSLLRKAAGLMILVLGAHLAGLLRIRWLERQFSLNLDVVGRPALGRRGVGRSFLLGVAFSAGWHPCVGPILGAILAYAGTVDTLTAGIKLLLAYSAGMAVPFLLLAVSFERLRPLVVVLSRHALAVSRVTGFLLMAMGAAIYFDVFARLSRLVPTFLAL